MEAIKISVRDKIASSPSATMVCGNTDYRITFDFDAEWGEHPVKTARFAFNDSYIDVVFEGETVSVPIITDTLYVAVGVYAGDLQTTTPALIATEKSILCGKGLPADPPPDVYAQIINLLNEHMGDEQIAKAVGDYLTKNPVSNAVESVNGKTGAVKLTAADVDALPADTEIPSIEGLAAEKYVDNAIADKIKAPKTAEVGNALVVSSVDENGFPTEWVAAKVGGSSEWKLLHYEKLTEDVAQLVISAKGTKAIFIEWLGRFNNADDTAADANVNGKIAMGNIGRTYIASQIGYVRKAGRAICTHIIFEKITGKFVRFSKILNLGNSVLSMGYSITDNGYQDDVYMYPDDTNLLFKAGGSISVWGVVE